MIASKVELARNGEAHGCAVAAVNILDELSSPVIVQVSVKTAWTIGVDLMTKTFAGAGTSAPVPVALDLDHCPDRRIIAEVVRAGWSSVLFDASDRDLAQPQAQPEAESDTAEVVALAHAVGVDVESEIENIIGMEDGVGSDVAVHSYSVDVLAEVAERTGADLIAPRLGTAHGEHKSSPVLLLERVQELSRLTDAHRAARGHGPDRERLPLLHRRRRLEGQHLDRPEACLHAVSARLTCARPRSRAGWDPPSEFADITRAVKAEVLKRLEIFGSAGHADGAATSR